MGERAATLGLWELIRDGDRFAYIEGWRYEQPDAQRQLLDWLGGSNSHALLVYDSLLEAGCPSESGSHPNLDRRQPETARRSRVRRARSRSRTAPERPDQSIGAHRVGS